MEVSLKENGKIIWLMVRENLPGVMENIIMENGRIVWWMV